MNKSVSKTFAEARYLWFEHVAAKFLNSTTNEVFKDTDCSLQEQAMLVVHVGIGHLYGVADSDSCIEGVLSPKQVETLISRYWRDGNVSPNISRLVPFLWSSVYRLGRDTSSIRVEILEPLFDSQLGRRLRNESDHDLTPTAVDTRAIEYVKANPIQACSTYSVESRPLDCDGSHLCFIATLLDEGNRNVLEFVTLFEIFSCLPTDDEALSDIGALEEAGNRHEIFRSMPGGWPGPGPSDVPGWVRDVVINVGARMYYASTGHVPGWLIVAESDDELRAIQRWTYEPKFGFGIDSSGDPVLSIGITYPSDGVSADAWWVYPLRDSRSVNRLSALIAIGVVRLDIYRISSDAKLEFVFAFGCPLPIPLRDACRQFLRENSLPPSEVRLFRPMTPEDDLWGMSLVERNLYDGLSVGLQALRADEPLELARAFRTHLESLDATTAATFGGLSIDDLYQESRERWKVAITQSERPPQQTIDLAVLGAERGYVQFRLRLDWPAVLVAHVAYVNQRGELKTLTVEFEGDLNATWDVNQQAEALCEGLSELVEMLSEGITSLIICPAPTVYNLPYHEALLRLGFNEVSYTHRLETLRSSIRSTNAETGVLGFAGVGDRYIGAVEVELDIVAETYGVSRTQQLAGPLPSVLHLAGHGHAGSRTYETAMEISATGTPLSSARVMLDFDASECELVFLSACSSGAGVYLPDQMVEGVPMDVAFIESGARTVISTSRPVNDFIACFFAAVFHSALHAGNSIWGAYLEARDAAKSGKLPVHSAALEQRWPTWEVDVRAALSVHPHDWQNYRLSGRYWD